jgi:hypothetical protein
MINTDTIRYIKYLYLYIYKQHYHYSITNFILLLYLLINKAKKEEFVKNLCSKWNKLKLILHLMSHAKITSSSCLIWRHLLSHLYLLYIASWNEYKYNNYKHLMWSISIAYIYCFYLINIIKTIDVYSRLIDKFVIVILTS